MKRSIRMGIDVGGTHTKAVAIDNSTYKIIGKSSVKTTHDSKDGVAVGVVNAFLNCLKENNIDPSEVIFVAHSTTQATNALLEGDVANVGVIGISNGGLEAFLAKRQTKIKDIDLGTGRIIKIFNSFIKRKELTEENIKKVINELEQKGAKVVVASKAFGVDDFTDEEKVQKVAESKGIATTIASDITKLYGLTRRTRTAAINASILPKMLETAEKTEMSVRKANVKVPLMIMRGDGGVMDIAEMKKRPVLTMLSGPAASVMGSLMYLRASNGVYFEVGGTSTNIGVIKNGRPAIDYSVLGGHKTYINSLDVIVLGVAGGSMVRLNKNGIVDVGPRSAHIAGLDYAVFTDISEIEEPELELYSPKDGDPNDYVAIKLKTGKRVTITNSCAANVLGLINENHFSYGNVESARKAMKPLADYTGKTIEELAKEILEKSYLKIKPVIEHLAEKYKLDYEQISLVGVGGGASSLLPYCAEKMNLKYNIPEHAEVISSIGVALAMVRDVVERVIPNPTPEDIKNIKKEVYMKAIESGAEPSSIEIHVDIDSQTSKVIAIALGSTEVKTADLLKECDYDEALKIASDDMKEKKDNVKLISKNNNFYVFATDSNERNNIRIIDKKGFIKVQRKYGLSELVKVHQVFDYIDYLWETLAVYTADAILRPDLYILIGAKIMDYSGTIDFEQLKILISLEIEDLDGDEELIVVGVKNEI